MRKSSAFIVTKILASSHKLCTEFARAAFSRGQSKKEKEDHNNNDINNRNIILF
jgi:hypothetical protein